MLEIAPFESLGRFDNDWLSARYHFSFAGYHDPKRTGVGPLLVWNDDTIRPGRGFDPHGHRNMEIITYVRQGAISHRDHLGNEGRTEAGDVQVMTAGRGIRHAEYNLESEETQVFQIWIEPNESRLEPSWATEHFPTRGTGSGFTALASGRESLPAPLVIHQDAALLGASLEAGQTAVHRLGQGRQAYLVAAKGRFTVNGQDAKARDGITITSEDEIVVESLEETEILIADLPA